MTSSRKAYILIGLGFLIRFIYVQFIHPIGASIYSDMANYVQVAEAIQRGDWRITHFFQPIGFPYLIYLLKVLTPDWILALGLIQVTTSTLTLYFIWKLASHSFNERVGLMSLALAVIHIPWIIFSGLCLAENIFIFFLAILAWYSWKVIHHPNLKNAAIWGIIFFLAFLFKGTHIFIVPLFLAVLLIWKKKESLKVVVLISTIIWSGFFAHGYLTYKTVGKFQMSASAGGLNFVEGKCPTKNNADSAGYSWLSPLYYQLGMTEKKTWDKPFTDSTYFMQQGMKCISKNPLVLIQSLEGIPFLFIGNFMWPSSGFKYAGLIRLYELIFAVFSLAGLVIFIRFFKYEQPFQGLLVWLIPISGLFLTVYIFKSEIRFRVPFDVWIIPMAVKGWRDLWMLRPALSQRP